MKKTIAFVILVVLTLASFAAFANPTSASSSPIPSSKPTSTPNSMTTIELLTSIGGTTTPAAGNYTNYSIDNNATFTATPTGDFELLYWIVSSASGAYTYTINPLVYNITTNSITIQAMFIPTSNATSSTYSQTGSATVNILTSVGGTTTPAAGTLTYNIGTIVNFTANPDNGFRFLYWIVSASVPNAFSDNPLAYNVATNSCTIQPLFVPNSSNIISSTATTTPAPSTTPAPTPTSTITPSNSASSIGKPLGNYLVIVAIIAVLGVIILSLVFLNRRKNRLAKNS